jgi:hypothetical protein
MSQLEARIAELGGLTPIRGRIPLDDQSLAKLEAKIGARLPAPYRDFVQHYGGSLFDEYLQCVSKYILPAFLSKDGRVPVGEFLGASSSADTKYSTLEAAIDTYTGRMPETVIPIADDGGGNKVCIGIRGNELGKIFYWDHNNEWDEEDYVDEGLPVPEDLPFQNCHLIADSFSDFIMQLVLVE